MRGVVAPVLCAFVLSACGSSGGGSAALTPVAALSGDAKTVSGNTVVGAGSTLWVGTNTGVYAYPKLTNGPAPAPLRSIAFPSGWNGVDTTVAPDNTVYESFFVAGMPNFVALYSPRAQGAARPEQTISGHGTEAVLVGDGIDLVDDVVTPQQGFPGQCHDDTVSTFAYAAGDDPSPTRTLDVPFGCYPLSAGEPIGPIVATDAEGRVYVYDFATVKVYKAGSCGSASTIRVVPVAIGWPAGFTVGRDKTIYILVRGNIATGFSVEEWAPGNNTTTPTRTLGWFVTDSAVGGGGWQPTAIAVDGKDHVFVGLAGGPNGASEIRVFAAGASGQAAPIATITNPVPAGSTVSNLAIGP